VQVTEKQETNCGTIYWPLVFFESRGDWTLTAELTPDTLTQMDEVFDFILDQMDKFIHRGRELFWQGMPDRVRPFDLSQVAHAYEMYRRILDMHGGKIGGFFIGVGTGDRPDWADMRWTLRQGVTVMEKGNNF
jgi:hypothetical protein